MNTSTISTGQTISGQSFTNGDSLVVAYGGTSTSNFIGTPSAETVYGFSFGDTVSGARLIAGSGSFVSGAQIIGGATLTVAPGAAVYGGVLSGGSATVSSGGVLHAMSVGSGGDVEASGQVIGGSVGSGGRVALTGGGYGGGTASGLTVGSGGTLNISLNTAVGTILSGGSAFVDGNRTYLHGSALGTTILAGGVLLIESYGIDSGTVVGSGGLEQLDPAGSSVGAVISGGTLELLYGYYGDYLQRGTAQESGPITFAGHGGTLLDDGPAMPASVISGFDATDHIILAGVPADPHATLTVAGDFATVSAGGQTYTMDIAGASSLPLTLGIGTTSGTIDIGIACYCAGTAILTTEGEVAVERIAPGDCLITADGRAEPVVWVGRRSYAGRFLRRQPHLLPIRIRAGALGRWLPRRDLLVSPNHALLLDGVLVPASALVDGQAITVEHGCAQVEYHHIELAGHNVILAEGVPAETFLDDDSRGIFQEGDGIPGDASRYCAPRVSDGFGLEAIRRRLAGLAQRTRRTG